MRYVTAEEMRGIDKTAIEDYGIPGIVLMENAVLKVLKHMPIDNESYTVVAGSGNNGGDGTGVARHLHIAGKSVSIVFLGSQEKLKGDAKTNFEIVRRLSDKSPENPNIRIIEVDSENQGGLDEAKDVISGSDVIVDAIFGTGISSEVRGDYRAVIEAINKSEAYTVAVDIPSGLNGDSGEAMGVAVVADRTVTLQYPKVGFKNENAKTYLGELVVEEIGIPKWI